MVNPAPITPIVEILPAGTLDKTVALTLDIAAKPERYPLLRNAFQN